MVGDPQVATLVIGLNRDTAGAVVLSGQVGGQAEVSLFWESSAVELPAVNFDLTVAAFPQGDPSATQEVYNGPSGATCDADLVLRATTIPLVITDFTEGLWRFEVTAPVTPFPITERLDIP
jgi:hypothetical protein